MRKTHLGTLMLVALCAAGCPTTTDGSGSTSSGGSSGSASGVSSSQGGSGGSSSGGGSSATSASSGADGGVEDGGVPAGEALLETAAAGARACEVLLADPDAVVLEALESSRSRVRMLARGGRVAVAFSAVADAALQSGDVTLRLRGGSAAAAQVTVVGSRCFDAQGQALAGSSVTLTAAN